MLKPLPVGNAIRIFIAPPETAERWRVMRRMDDCFQGENDPDAVCIYDGCDDRIFLDANFLTNGKTYFYRLFCKTGDVWGANDTKSAVPACTFVCGGEEPQLILRDRLDFGLVELLKRRLLHHPNGKIPVLTAPPTFDGTVFPVVVVQFTNGSSSEYGVGDFLGQILDEDRDEWEIDEGWLSQIQLTVVAWSLNADERIRLRRAIEYLLIANISVLDDAGMTQIVLQQSDHEDYQSYAVPMYQSVSTISCLIPRYVGHHEDRIRLVDVKVKGS